MPRPNTKTMTPAQKKAHAARLAKRRERHANRVAVDKAVAAAIEGGEGGADFDKMVEEERKRLENQYGLGKHHGVEGGSKSPKVTVTARDNLAKAFDFLGGVPALVAWGKANPTEFYRIWARLIPKEVAEPVGAIPLESLLEKLATREHMSVHAAAIDIGQETMEAARKQVEIEDATGLRPEDIN